MCMSCISSQWSPLDDVLEQLLRLWTHVQNAFNKTNASFSKAFDRQSILELRSNIHPNYYIQRVAQAMHKYTNVMLFILLMNAYFTVLDDSKPLKIYDPVVPQQLIMMTILVFVMQQKTQRFK
jgi:hypothetical protein